MKSIKRHKYKSIPFLLLFILLVSVFFRFYRLNYLFQFGMDQEYELFLVKNIISGLHFPAIGVNAGDTGIYLGPIFIYLTVFPFMIFSGNPLGLAFTASLLGVLTTYVIFLTVSDMFSRRSAYISAFIYAASFLASFYDRNFWNPSPVPLLSMFMAYCIYKIDAKNFRYLYLLALTFGLSFHVHLSLVVFTPLIIWIILKHRKKIPRNVLLLSLGLFIFLQSPQILFEFKHGFTNTKAVIQLVSKSAKSKPAQGFFQKGEMIVNYFGRYLWVPPVPDTFLENGLCTDLTGFKKNSYPEITGFIFILFIMFFYFRDRVSGGKKSSVKTLTSIILLGIIFIFIYKGPVQEYYLGFLTPLTAVLLGVFLNAVWNYEHGREIVLSFLFFYLIINLTTLFTAQNSYPLSRKTEIIRYVKENLDSKNYSLEALGDCPRFAGWRYLFEYYVGKPESSYMDSYFSWLYGSPKSLSPDRVVLLSLIDSRSGESLRKWVPEKINYLTGFNILSQKTVESMQVYILAPKK